ncbi:zinc finger protein CONSTANS-LIKE 13-like isoform X1 [Triticum dicoccoides]|nr:zinc finger protein CONSTANS-LIKE 13-like isoform X1 [Triticum dicoccoides]XP_044363508.1 zinc finger protein CONSTANS-LIKE 13-like isoform X1 [Triticum aestivum]
MDMGQDERQDPELPAMEKELSADAVACDYCSGPQSVVYCRADSARLCLPCDRHVHAANAVCSRHLRAPLCAACRATGAVFRHGGPEFLCSNCDFGRSRDGELPLHDRCTVQGYTGRPSAHDLAALLGVPDLDKPSAGKADDGWWAIWEEPQVFSLEDLIVPTTSCHSFQPLVTPSSPKIQNSPEGKTNDEVIRQLRELAEVDMGGGQITPREEAEQAAHQLPSWTESQHTTGNGDFGTDNSHEVATMPTPGYENGGWNNNDCHALKDDCKTEYEQEQAPANSAEACLSLFVQMSELCPSMSNGGMMDDSQQANPGIGMPMQAFPKRSGFDVVAGLDRDIVISRYKEKRRTRRFDKQVRYESRKARADSRLRIKGRFAKANQS